MEQRGVIHEYGWDFILNVMAVTQGNAVLTDTI